LLMLPLHEKFAEGRTLCHLNRSALSYCSTAFLLRVLSPMKPRTMVSSPSCEINIITWFRVQLGLITQAAKWLLRLWDTIWGVFHALNAITRGAHLHQTMATKDGSLILIERHLVHKHPKGIGYLVGTVCRGQSNFVNF